MTQGSLMQYSLQFAQIGQQITQILLSNSNPELLLANVAKVLGESFGVDFCLLMAVIQPTSQTNSALWCADHCPLPLAQQLQVLEYKALNNQVADQPIAFCELDFGVSEQERDRQWEGLKIGAMLRVSTHYQSSINGFIVLGQLQPYEWTTLEKDLLKMISESVGIAISKVQQSIQTQAATRHQTLLNQLSQALPSALDLDEILQIATASTAQSLMVDRGLLLLLKYSNPLFKNQPSKHLPKAEMTVACEWFAQSPQSSISQPERPPSLLNQTFWLSESELCQQAYRNAPEPIAIANRLAPPHITTESLLERELMPAVLLVPLVGAYSHARSSTVIGFLVFQHHQARLWNAEELELVKWVSVQVSATIVQNQTLRQVQSLVEDRTAQLQRSLEIQAKLYEKTRQQMNQLQQLNLLKDEFLSSMSHELRTPLTTMSLAIRMLRHPQITQERRDKYLEILEQECNKEIDLISDLLSLQRLESNQSQLQPQNIDLMLLLKDLNESFEKKWASKRLTLTIESPANSLYLHTDPDSLNRILLELLTNAGKYSHPDTTISLQITHPVQPSKNQLVITLSNTGSGISKSDLTQIFEKFHRGQGVTKKAVQGTGLGLALVKCLVQNLNGTIEVTSTPIANSDSSNYLTAFTLTLPLLQKSAE
ncbi:MAG: ATP-binding protein [Coleofasciculaceae cyanobacterium]